MSGFNGRMFTTFTSLNNTPNWVQGFGCLGVKTDTSMVHVQTDGAYLHTRKHKDWSGNTSECEGLEVYAYSGVCMILEKN